MFFKKVSHRVFDYQPRYYNERKERLELLKKTAQQEDKTSIQIKENIRNSFRASYRDQKFSKKSPLRIFLIVILLFLLFWFVFDLNDIYIPN